MNKHEPNCPMLQGQGAACTCGIPPDPYPPMSDAKIERLDKFYALDPSGINANERRLLANIRELKAELKDATEKRLCDCCGDALLDIVNDFVESDTGRNPLAERVVQLEKELAELRAANARLICLIANPNEPKDLNNPNHPVYRGPHVKPKWVSPADTRIGELGGPRSN